MIENTRLQSAVFHYPRKLTVRNVDRTYSHKLLDTGEIPAEFIRTARYMFVKETLAHYPTFVLCDELKAVLDHDAAALLQDSYL